MPRFFFHIHDWMGFTEDEEGVELADLGTAGDRAVAGARSIISDEVLEGRLDLRGRIDVADERGAVLLTVPFRETVQMIEGDIGDSGHGAAP